MAKSAMGVTLCVLLMLGSGMSVAQPSQRTRPDEELATVRRELRAIRFKTPDVESAAREAQIRQRCLELAQNNPGTKAELTALYMVAGQWPETEEGKHALQALSRAAQTADLHHLRETFESLHVRHRESMPPLIPVLLRRERQNPNHPYAAKLLTEACLILKPNDDDDSVPDEFTEIADRIVDHHATSPKLANFCEILGGHGEWCPPWAQPFEPHLRRILRANKDRFVRCSAKIALASLVREAGSDRQAEAGKLYEEFLAEFDGTVEYHATGIEEMYRHFTQRALEGVRSHGIGMEAPETSGIDLEGNPITLADYRGRVVLVSFWATWCFPCMKMIPHEKNLVERFSAEKFAIVGISGDTDVEAARQAVAHHDIPWRSFRREPEDQIANQWHIAGWPTFYLLDADGIVRKRWQGGPPLDDLNESIEQLIDEGTIEAPTVGLEADSDTKSPYTVIDVTEDAPEARGFLEKKHQSNGNSCKYVVFIPHDYRSSSPTPAILFLHGSGYNGTDGRNQLTGALANAIVQREQEFPFITIFPQSQEESWQADSPDGKRAIVVLKEVSTEYAIDSSRVYLTGLSMGGEGTWSLAAAYPDHWAAIVPLCGGGDPAVASRIKHIPCWCFHGDADRMIDPLNTRRMVEAIRKAGGQPTYQVYPGVGHNCWDRTYARTDLYEWLLLHRRPSPD